MTIAARLAEHVARATYDVLPTSAVRAAKVSLLDTLAVSIAAADAPGVREVTELAIVDGGRATSSLWTRAARVPPRAAAFVNGFVSSALDFDSLHPEGVAHADIVIVPACVAVGEDRAVSGKTLLTAIAVGDDLLCRLCRSTRQNSGWFYTSLYGPIASAAVTAKLLGGEVREIDAAMGVASLSASGTQQPALERSLGKRMQGALAAAAGVQAGYLGMSRLAGPREIIEGRFGLYAMHEKGDVGAIIDGLGVSYENGRIGYKFYPSCQCNHAAIEGMLELKRVHGLTADNVSAVEVSISSYMHRLVGAPFAPGANPQVDAQFSMQYSVASVLLFGRLGVPEISSEKVLDPRISEFVPRVSLVVDPTNSNNYEPVRIRVTTTAGAVIEHNGNTYRGSETRPLTDADLREKLAMCMEAAGTGAAHARASAAFDAIMNIEDVPDVTSFVPALLARCRD
jgi:2-methylcitrate dehydratase PrpD